MRKTLVVFSILTVFVVVGCGGGSGGSPQGGQSTGGATSPQGTTNSNTLASRQHLPIGQSAEVGGNTLRMVVTVDRVHTVEPDPHGPTLGEITMAQRGQSYVVADVTVENSGSRSFDVEANESFVAKDQDGYELIMGIPGHDRGMTQTKGKWDGQFEPGQKRSGEVSYAAEKTDSVVLQFTPQSSAVPGNTAPLASWNLGRVADMPTS